jgi:hypothetical protein
MSANNGTAINPARVRVTSVSGGAVTGYEMIDGGGYTGTLPGTLTFTSPDPWVTGTGFQLTAKWGARYSANYNFTGGIIVTGPASRNVITGNQISGTKSGGPGIVFWELGAPPLNGKLNFSTMTGNVLSGNDGGAIKHKLGVNAFDDLVTTNNAFAGNLGYP